ncbi:MAG: phospho-sugar mutase [Tenericutes bacterium]|jgi:phosphoglucomutase|nr:phospho-sugar mutase [Mycoplasmatota bacterium]
MWQKEYKKWLDYEDLDTNLREALLEKSESELEEMFYQSLSFGTGGMRGILGPGTNRLNIYTIRRANAGLAKYLKIHYSKEDLKRGVVIAHDNRHLSKDFARESAKVLGAQGIKSYVFTDLRPTPELSFAVRHLNAIAGIVVTASHNPPNYNGYKIYDEYGCQYTPTYANEIIEYVNEVEDLFGIEYETLETLESQGLVDYIDSKIDDAYIQALKTIQIHPEISKELKIVFTPLHGTSAVLGTRILNETGYDIYPVKEQMIPDPNFSTVKSPNPEDKSAFNFAMNLGKEIKADLLIATDPDGDRLGVAVKDNNNFKLLNGNQTGALLIYYLLNEKKKLNTLPEKGVVFNTIVTSNLGAEIARSFNMDVISTLTGFKFIGEQARYLEKEDRKFVFGYEESYGYVIKDFVRDKDSLQAMLMISEAANYYHEKENKSLFDKLKDIYKEYGYYLEDLKSIVLEGKSGKEQISRIMSYFRENPLNEFNGLEVSYYEDFKRSIKVINKKERPIELEKSNVIKYTLDDGSWFVLRPSGTEPKLKLYAGVVTDSFKESEALLKQMLDTLSAMVKKVE